MSRPVKLSERELTRRSSNLPDWKVKGGKLHREYAFANFVAAFGFMTSAALIDPLDPSGARGILVSGEEAE